jgi:DNA-binding protein
MASMKAHRVNQMPRASRKKNDNSDPEETETAKQTEEEQKKQAPQNHIFVGKKPVMSYAMSALIQLTQSNEVVLKARGLAISRAVDVAEIVTKRLGNGQFKVKSISIGTETVGTETEKRNVSSIEIVLGR